MYFLHWCVASVLPLQLSPRLNWQQGNGDSGRFVQRRGSWKLNHEPLLLYESAQKSAMRSLLARRDAESRKLVCAARIHCAAACAVPAILSPRPTASLRSFCTLLIPGMLAPQVATSSTRLEADRYDHYISHRKCTVRGRNHRPLARLDRPRRLQRIATARTLLTAHSLWPLVCAVAIESRHRLSISCSSVPSPPRCSASSAGSRRWMAAAWRAAAAAPTRSTDPPGRLSRRLQAEPRVSK